MTEHPYRCWSCKRRWREFTAAVHPERPSCPFCASRTVARTNLRPPLCAYARAVRRAA